MSLIVIKMITFMEVTSDIVNYDYLGYHADNDDIVSEYNGM